MSSFCGFRDEAAHATFRDESQRMLHYRRANFCTIEGSDDAPQFSQCCSPRKPGGKFFPCVEGFEPPAPLPACAHPKL